MNRRQVLQTVAIGGGSSVAGCLSWFDDSGGADGDASAAVDCDLTPFEQLERGWSPAYATVPHMGPEIADNVRHVTVEGRLDDPATDVLHAFDHRPTGPTVPEHASPGTVCYRTPQDEFVFLDADSGEDLWRVGVLDPPERFAPPDGTTAHRRTHVEPVTIADGMVYLRVTYTAQSSNEPPFTLSTGIFAVDATDGTVEWSRPGLDFGSTGQLQVDGEGRLFVTGTSNALLRADPDERTRNETGAWTPDPRADGRVHVRALDARTGESCWEWDTELPGSDAASWRLVSYGVVGGRIVVRIRQDGASQSAPPHTLLCLDAETGDEYTSIEYWGSSTKSVLGTAERLLLITEKPPVSDAPTDGETLFAIDPDREEIDWMVPSPGDKLRAATGDVAVVGDETLVGVELATGDTRWEVDWAVSDPAVGLEAVTDTVLVSSDRREAPLAGLDPETGDTLWEIEAVETVVGVVGETLVTAALATAELRLRSLDSGELGTRIPLDGGVIPAGAVAADGQLYFVVRTEDVEDQLVVLT